MTDAMGVPGGADELQQRLRRSCLGELATRAVSIPRRWASARTYDWLVEQGWATSERVGQSLNRYAITEAGRAELASSTVEPLIRRR